jgi:hypothetical protein
MATCRTPPSEIGQQSPVPRSPRLAVRLSEHEDFRPAYSGPTWRAFDAIFDEAFNDEKDVSVRFSWDMAVTRLKSDLFTAVKTKAKEIERERGY